MADHHEQTSSVEPEFALSYAVSAESNVAYDLTVPAEGVHDHIEIPLDQLYDEILQFGRPVSGAILIVRDTKRPNTESNLTVDKISRLMPGKEAELRFAGRLGIIRPDEHRVLVGNEEVHVPLRDYEMLELLASAVDKVVTLQQFRDKFWDGHADRALISVHIGRLRKILDSVHPGMGHVESGAVQSVNGVGYKLLRQWPPLDLSTEQQ